MLNLIYGLTAFFFWGGYIYQHIFQAFFDGRNRANQHLLRALQKAGKIVPIPQDEPDPQLSTAHRELH